MSKRNGYAERDMALTLAKEAIRVLEDALVIAEARLGEVGYRETEAICDRALREARAIMKGAR